MNNQIVVKIQASKGEYKTTTDTIFTYENVMDNEIAVKVHGPKVSTRRLPILFHV